MKILSTLLLILFVGCSKPLAPTQPAVIEKPLVTVQPPVIKNSVDNVSIIALIANPNYYNGKRVRITGAINLDFEARMICLHGEDIIKVISKNCIWVSFDSNNAGKSDDDLARLNKNYVMVEGTFDSSPAKSSCSGAITNISSIEPRGSIK